MRRSHYLGTADASCEVNVDDILKENFTTTDLFAWLVAEDREELWDAVKEEFSKEIDEMIEESKEE